MKLFFLPLFLISLACTEAEVAKKSDNGSANADASNGNAADKTGFEESGDLIESVTYDSKAHALVIELSGSNCGENNLKFDKCADSYPTQCTAILQKKNIQDQVCDASIPKFTYSHKLETSFDASYVTIKSKQNKSKAVLVDKTGDVAKNSAPPASTGETEQSEATISELVYDKTKHALTMKLTYGGCDAAKHKLQFSDFCNESYPMQCSAVLLREKGSDKTCKKLTTETFTHQLQETFDTTVLTINAKTSKASILVDRLGKIPAAQK